MARPLLYVGIVVILAVLATLHAHRESYGVLTTSRFPWTVAYGLLLVLASYGAGLPDLPRSSRQTATAALIASVSGAVGISLIQLATGSALLPRFVVFGSMVLVFAWAMLCVALARGGALRAESRDRVVAVCDRSAAELLLQELRQRPERPAMIVEHLTLDEARSSGERSRPLVERSVAMQASLVVLDRMALLDLDIVGQAATLHENGVRVRPLRLFYDEWLGKLPLSELERQSLLFDIRELHGSRYVRVKRVLDVCIGLASTAAFLVAVPFVLVGNLLGNRGPLFYRQERVGKNDAVFTIYKFRTMRDAPPGTATSWTQERDPRVTTFGRVLRRTHLDELPQALNILRGDLSVVGPRPEQPRYVEELVASLPYYDMRHLVRPGLTGWAQVKYGYAGDERGTMEKLQYEFWYLSHQSLALDARIVGRTIRSVFGGEGSGR